MLENLNKYNIVLASASPRRRELLEMLGIRFQVMHGKNVNEVWPEDLDTEKVAPYLARLKAEAYRHDFPDNTLLITADTVVICENQLIGKPIDHDDAVRMLHFLSGKTHHVVTGVCVVSHDRIEEFSSTTSVSFAVISDSEIKEYVYKHNPLDKAGAYGIQEAIGAIAVRNIDGSYYNVMGLPVHKLYGVLKTF